MKTRKRAKFSHHEEITSASLPRSDNLSVKPEDLNWEAAALPETLENYEGFFGLEEIEDVEVIRTDQGPKFYPRATDQTPDSEDEWAGIQDDGSSVFKISSLSKSAENKRKIEDVKKDLIEPGLFSSSFHNLQDRSIDLSNWKSLELPPRILSALSRLKFRSPTPIQTATIPHIFEGDDVIGKAPTGSGKTLAFGIPIFDCWLDFQAKSNHAKLTHHPIALIISPTRELAHQIADHLEALVFDETEISPKIATLTGGLSIQKQKRNLEHASIIVSTPGRLWELIEDSKSFLDSLKQIRFLVIDEADRLLSVGHFQELQLILDALDRQIINENIDFSETASGKTQPRQTLVFSATFHKDLQRKLSKRTVSSVVDSTSSADSMAYLLKRLRFSQSKPKFVDVSPVSQMAAGLREGLIQCPRSTDKDLYVYGLLALYYSNSRSLVFVNSISAVRRLVPFLQNLNLKARGLHSQMPQKARLRSVEDFSASQECSILVATDVAARGLDILNIEIVIHYHLPRTADTYVHRSGRTARASKVGFSILLYAPEEAGGVKRLISQIHSNSNEEKRIGSKSSNIESLHMDSRIVARLQPRVMLSKRIADAVVSKGKKNSEDKVLRNGAKDLGIEYSSDEFQNSSILKTRGRTGQGRKQREKDARALTKAELREMKLELSADMNKRLNIGVSARYLTASGPVNIDKLSKEQEISSFFGRIPDLGWGDR